MKFTFNIEMSNQDYYEYNKFMFLKSAYSKNAILLYKVLITVVFAAIILFELFDGKFTAYAFISAIPAAVLMVVWLQFDKIYCAALKSTVKHMAKKGKLLYSEHSYMEFFEDYFTEVSDTEKSEKKYTAIERISIIENKAVFIHINRAMSHMVYKKCAETDLQYAEFVEFIKTKCENVDIYKENVI